MITVDVDTRGLDEKIKELRKATGKSLAATLRSEGRLLAVALAKYTQPFGFDDEAKAKGEAAIARDYERVYPSPDTAKSAEFIASKIANSARPKDRAAAKIRYLRYLEAGNTAAMEKMLQNMHITFDYAKRADPSYHATRWSRGKIHKGKTQVVLSRGSVKALIKAAQKKVGFAKSGWSNCAKELGGVRGIPSWVHRGNCPSRVIVAYETPDLISVSLINMGNFTSQVLSETGKRGAIAERKYRITARIDMILKAELQKVK